MKFKNPLLVVSNLETSKHFYKEILGLHVVLDLGANVTMTGGIALQTKETWCDFIQKGQKDVIFSSNNTELYFEEDDFDDFMQRLKNREDIQYVHPVKVHDWGQRVIRFYDPDYHIIEVGENLKLVGKRFLDNGLTIEQTAEKMGMPIKFIQSCVKQ